MFGEDAPLRFALLRLRRWSAQLIGRVRVGHIQGVATTQWLASHRLGDSIIPRERELARLGPCSMSEIRIRNAVLVRFTNQDGTVAIDQNATDFYVP